MTEGRNLADVSWCGEGMRPSLAGVFVCAALLAGCAEPSVEAEPSQRYTTLAAVLEDGKHGPQLCLGAMATSNPPQCGGPDIKGWDWTKITGFESAVQTKWGNYVVVGTYRDRVFTLTEPPIAEADYTGPNLRPPLSTPDITVPCLTPSGGWRVLDPARTTEATLQAMSRRASSFPEFAGLWVSHSIEPIRANDPRSLVLVVKFTGKLAEYEAELRKIWGGALCVVQGAHTEATLSAIQRKVTGGPDFVSSGTDIKRGVVELTVIVGEGLQEQLDSEYGAGVVEVSPRLRPVD